MTDSLDDQLQQLLRGYSQLVDSPFNPGEEIRILRGTATEEGIDSGLIPELKALIAQREAEVLDALTIGRREILSYPAESTELQVIRAAQITGWNECVDTLEARKAKLTSPDFHGVGVKRILDNLPKAEAA